MSVYKITEDHVESTRKNKQLRENIYKTFEGDEGRINYVYGDKDPKIKKTRLKSAEHAKELGYGEPTIGVGYKLRKGDEALYEMDIDDNWIDEKRNETVEEAIDYAKYIAKNHRKSFDFDNLPLPQQEALVNLVFNVGMGELRSWTNTLDYLAEGNYKEASKEILRGRTKDSVSRYATRLPNRSKRVSEQMATV
jgi:GH24 family phage-related lysozyme (muramidase)